MFAVVVYMTLIAIGFYFGKWLGAVGLVVIYFFYFHGRQIARQQQIKEDRINSSMHHSIADLSWAYHELNVSEHADKYTIIRARKKLLNNYHPDKLGKISDVEKVTAENKITQINKAYQAIKIAKGF